MANLEQIDQTFKVISYEVGEFGIAVMLKKGDCDVKHIVIKDQFETWLTGGTGEVEYATLDLDANNDLKGNTATMPIEAYWNETEAVILTDLYGYLSGTENNRKKLLQPSSLKTTS